MSAMDRRSFVQLAIAMGATVAWGGTLSATPATWHERRDLFAEGVASGDPEPDSVLLWTRRSPDIEPVDSLQVQIAEDESFHRIIATAHAPHLCCCGLDHARAVGGLKPATVYWYRFVDPHGNGSRVGRTITAPAEDDPRPVRFAFVSCQNAEPGRAERLSPHDLRRRARAGRPAARLRAPPRRFHLRDRLVSGRPSTGHVRPPPARHRSLSAWRKDSRLPYPDNDRRLSRDLSRLSARS